MRSVSVCPYMHLCQLSHFFRVTCRSPQYCSQCAKCGCVVGHVHVGQYRGYVVDSEQVTELAQASFLFFSHSIPFLHFQHRVGVRGHHRLATCGKWGFCGREPASSHPLDRFPLGSPVGGWWGYTMRPVTVCPHSTCANWVPFFRATCRGP